jgi:hypothetical protein
MMSFRDIAAQLGISPARCFREYQSAMRKVRAEFLKQTGKKLSRSRRATTRR